MCKHGPLWALMLLALLAGACGTETTNGSGIDTPDGTSIEQPDAEAPPADVPQERGSEDIGVISDVAEALEDVDPGEESEGDTQGVEGEDSALDSDVGPSVLTGWQPEALGDLGTLSALFVIDSNEAYAVGGSQVLRFNGEAWASFGSLGDVELHGVWASEGIVVVVGEAGFIARRVVNELSWQIEESPTQQHLRAIHGRSPNDIWVAGNEGVILNYSDAEEGWLLVDQTSNIDLYGIHVDETQEGVAGVVTCGSGGRLVINDEGVWKTSHVASGDVILRGVYGVDGRLFVVGTGGTIAVRESQDGSWVGQPTNMTKDRDLYAVAASNQDKVYAFGASGTVLRWLGTSWQTLEVGAPIHAADDFVGASWVKGVDGDPGHWMAIGSGGGGITSEDGSVWSDMSTQPNAGLTGLVGDAEGKLWATGRSGLLMVRDSQGWTSVGTGTRKDLYALAFSQEGELWLVGEAGSVIVRDLEGLFSEQTVPAFSDLISVHHEPGLVVIGGKGGTILRRQGDAENFSPWTIGTTTDVRDIVRGADGALWIAGGFGKLYRSEDGEVASAVSSGMSGGLNAMAPHGDGVLIVGDNGAVLQADSSGEVTLIHEQSELFLYGLSVSDPYAVAVGWNGTALRLVDEDVIIDNTGANQVLEAVWHDGVSAIAVGRSGYAFTRMEGP